MKIADIELGDRPLFLAPMEDVTDPSFRYMCKLSLIHISEPTRPY